MKKKLYLILLGFCVMGLAFAQDIDSIHFLIPGGAGGGWDGTARGTGEALVESGLIEAASFENMSGGGGGTAIGYLIRTGRRQQGTLMVNSTPIITRSITKVFPYSFSDLTPIASIIGDYGTLVVKPDSNYDSFTELVAAVKRDPKSITIGGGSVFGDLDHLVAATTFNAAGVNPREINYAAYDAGGKALTGLLSGEIDVLATGLGEALELSRNGQVRILGITASERIGDAPEIPTFKEQGADAYFVNWRGFFGPPRLSQKKVRDYQQVLKKMYSTDEWEVVRKRNGWVNIYKPGNEFISFLKEQETEIRKLRSILGLSD